MPVTLPIIHFNDVYRVRQKDKASGGTIGADQFAAKIQSIRESWGEPSDLSNLPPPPPASSSSGSRDWTSHSTSRQRKGLVLFSGDLYSPSVESSVTRGTHLIPVINAMNLDCACLGNHDWDFGYPHLQTLMTQNNFPWLFSNVVDRSGKSEEENKDCRNWDEDFLDDDAQVEGTLRYWTTVVQGVKVGCIGIVEKEWIATVPSFPEGFVYRNMVKTADKLSRILRDPQGEACELVIAITHSRLPNDIDFANAVGAFSNPDPNSHGVDLVLGGHDHIYYVGNGASDYSGDEFPRGEPGTEKDERAMVVKSGTDFRDLSELRLELSDANDSAVRKRTILSLGVKRYRASPTDPSSPELKSMLDDLLAKISKSTSQSVAYTLTPWDVRSEKVRTDESAFGNFVADVLMNSYEEVLRERDNRGELNENRPSHAREVDCAIICGGSLRGDQTYGPGKIALSDVLEILPFEDAVVCKELKGRDVWEALENALSMYPKQEGRFPQVAGLMVKWDSRKEPGKRLVSVELLDNPLDTPKEGEGEEDVGKLRRFSVTKLPEGGYDVEVHRPALVSRGPLEMDKIYRVVTREYLAEGYDGFEALKRGDFVVDHENGQLMSAIVRKFLLGASYLWRMKQMRRLQAENAANLSASGSGDGSGGDQLDAATTHQSENGQEDRDIGTLSKRTRIAISRARSLNILKRSMKHSPPEAPSTPIKQTAMGRSGSLDKDTWRMVVDQSPGGFRDALHVGGSEHHSQFDRVHRRFNEPLSSDSKDVAPTSSHAATRTFDSDAATETGPPAAKRIRSEETPENALFDPTLASGLLAQIKELLALVLQAASPDGKLYNPPTGDGSNPTQQDDEVESSGANIALGSMAVDEADADATLAFLTTASHSAASSSRGSATQLSQEIVDKATALRSTFATLERAAKELPGGMDMGLQEQERLLQVLERFIAKQDESFAELKKVHRNGGNGNMGIASESFKHGAVASSSFHLDEGQMEKLRSDIRASAATGTENGSEVKGKSGKDADAKKVGNGKAQEEEDDTSNLAFVSPLVDGRLVDVARQQPSST
ncbi:5'-nucleotidase [Pseudozyma hubeiensis]|nr:5'-nucleotidase [Pseudozyma hubeiensis]